MRTKGLAGLGPLDFGLQTLRADRRLVNRWLAVALRSDRQVPGRLAGAMRYAVLGPGKRIRPVLALESFRAAGGRRERWIAPFCSGIEMIHAFSLVHDDLPSMDNDDFRRGRPSLHRRYDEATAILAADALLAFAFELFAASPAPAERRLAAIHEIASAVGPRGMAGGQMLDISRAVGSSRAVVKLHDKKTAEFFAASVVCGVLVAGAAPGVVQRGREAGRALGRLFQLTDDLLDAGQKGEAARPSLVRLCGQEGTRRRAVREAERAERLFGSLGRGFGLLAAFPKMILERKR